MKSSAVLGNRTVKKTTSKIAAEKTIDVISQWNWDLYHFVRRETPT
jgi:hypothetical protein